MATSQPQTDFIEENMTCRICRELFDTGNRTAKMLGCMHTFCKHCLEKMMEGRSDVLCPYCKTAWSVPPSGFPDNTIVMCHLEYAATDSGNHSAVQKIKCGNCPDEEHPEDAEGFCNDCDMYVCKTCIDHHKLMRANRGHEIDTLHSDEKMTATATPIRRRSTKPRCRRHTAQLLTIFCDTCKISLCNTCCLTTHDGHQRIELQTAVEKRRHILTTLSEQSIAARNPLQDLLSTLDTAIRDVEGVCAQQESAIDEEFRKLEELFRERCKRAKLEAQNQCEEKRDILMCQQNEVGGVSAEYGSASEYADQVCNVSNPEHFMTVQQQITQRLEELIHRDNSSIQFTSPLANNYLSFGAAHSEAVAEIQRITDRLCRVHTSDTLPVLCHVEPSTNPLQRQKIGALISKRKQKVIIQAMRYNEGASRKNSQGGDPFSVTLVNPDGTHTECPVDDQGDGTYWVTYTPMKLGEHSLDISVFGASISGSPFRFKVNRMQYTPVHRDAGNDLTVSTEDGVNMVNETWQCSTAVVGVPHVINIDDFNTAKTRSGELEAKVDIIKAEIRTDNGTLVPCTVHRQDGHAEVTYTPPVRMGNLKLFVTVNNQRYEPREITVTSLKNSVFSWEQQPVVGQRCTLTVGLRDHAKKEFKMDSANLVLAVHNTLTRNTERVQTLRARPSFDSKHEFECEVRCAGTTFIDLRVNGATVKTIALEVRERLQFPLSDDPLGGPTSIDTSSSGVIFISETKFGMIHVRSSSNKSFPPISVDINKKTTQITIDNRNTIFILDPEDRQVLEYTNKGRKISQWNCSEKNTQPVNIATSKHEDGLLAIGDASCNTMFLYTKNGTLVSSIQLPSGSLIDGLDNICVDNRNVVLVCHPNNPEILQVECNPDGCNKLPRSYPTRSTANQLAITTTQEGLVLVSEKGRIYLYHLTDDTRLKGEASIETHDHIYTSISATNEGCVIALEFGERVMVKYGYLHLLQVKAET